MSRYCDGVDDFLYDATVGAPLTNGGIILSTWAKPNYALDGSINTVLNLGGTAAQGNAHVSLRWFVGDISPSQNPQWLAKVFDGSSTTIEIAYTPASAAWRNVAVHFELDASGDYYLGLWWNGAERNNTSGSGMYTDYLAGMARFYAGCKLTGLTRSEYHDGYLGSIAMHTYSYSSPPAMNRFAMLADGMPPPGGAGGSLHAWWPLYASDKWVLRNIPGSSSYDLSASGASSEDTDNPLVNYQGTN